MIMEIRALHYHNNVRKLWTVCSATMQSFFPNDVKHDWEKKLFHSFFRFCLSCWCRRCCCCCGYCSASKRWWKKNGDTSIKLSCLHAILFRSTVRAQFEMRYFSSIIVCVCVWQRTIYKMHYKISSYYMSYASPRWSSMLSSAWIDREQISNKLQMPIKQFHEWYLLTLAKPHPHIHQRLRYAARRASFLASSGCRWSLLRQKKNNRNKSTIKLWNGYNEY